MYWYVGIEEKRVVGFDMDDLGIARSSQGLEIRYDQDSGIQLSAVRLGHIANIFHDEYVNDLICISKDSAIECLQNSWLDDFDLRMAFNEYLGDDFEVVYTVVNDYCVQTHMILHDKCAILTSVLTFSVEDDTVVRYEPHRFSVGTDLTCPFKTELEAITELTRRIEGRYQREMSVWKRCLTGLQGKE